MRITLKCLVQGLARLSLLAAVERGIGDSSSGDSRAQSGRSKRQQKVMAWNRCPLTSGLESSPGSHLPIQTLGKLIQSWAVCSQAVHSPYLER